MKICNREKKPKGIIRDPIDPYYLKLSGVINPAAVPPSPPLKDSAWKGLYHIFANSGSWNSDVFAGALHLDAPHGVSPNGDWLLRGRKILHDGGPGDQAFNRFDFEVSYKNGQPAVWKTRQATVRYQQDNSRNEVAKTVLSKSGLLEKEGWSLQTGKLTKQNPRPADRPVCTVEESLIYCQFWPLDPAFLKETCVLEELSVLRTEGLIYYNGNDQDPDGNRLHAFVLQARGQLPFEFWTNEKQRLVAGIIGSFGRSYIPAELAAKPLSDTIRKELEHTIIL